MKRISTITATALVLCASSWSGKSAENSSLVVGTWRVTGFSNVTLETNEVSRPFGENPIGYIQYSPGSHMIVFLSVGNPKKPAGFPYSDAERAEVHKGIFGAYAGTYIVEGNKITHRVVASWRPDWIGSEQVRYIELNGDKLTIKTAPLVSSATGKQVVSILNFERAE
jgi:hypothetical protein